LWKMTYPTLHVEYFNLKWGTKHKWKHWSDTLRYTSANVLKQNKKQLITITSCLVDTLQLWRATILRTEAKIPSKNYKKMYANNSHWYGLLLQLLWNCRHFMWSCHMVMCSCHVVTSLQWTTWMYWILGCIKFYVVLMTKDHWFQLNYFTSVGLNESLLYSCSCCTLWIYQKKKN